ncbi:hypothetical protein [Pectobacterium polaris]|uniref:hypothetical protein n=1 Tax=Pectobacterium polaris TaxID=2042057 RepID=UPI0021C9D33D|nr:hypothetical protein [Pectobacterium polaris]
MLKLSPSLALLPLFFSCFLFSESSIASTNKLNAIQPVKATLNIVGEGRFCNVKNKNLDKIIINQRYSAAINDRCIEECSYLIGERPGDNGSTEFHSCLAQCKGMIPMCDF